MRFAALTCCTSARARSLREHFTDEGDGVEWYSLSDEAQSFSAGRGSVIRVNCYDKAAEIQRSGKDWFRELCGRHSGYLSEKAVWRVEYQWGREFLKEMKVETVADLLERLPGVWAYSAGWFSFRTVNDGDSKHRSRWPVAPWWLALSAWRMEPAEPLARVRVVRPGYRQLVSGFCGYLTSLMALTELGDAAEVLTAACASLLALRGPTALDDVLAAKRVRYAGFTLASA